MQSRHYIHFFGSTVKYYLSVSCFRVAGIQMLLVGLGVGTMLLKTNSTVFHLIESEHNGIPIEINTTK